MDTNLTIITAPHSKTGKRVVNLFNKAGLAYRGASRTSEVPFDWTQPETWIDTLHSANAIYIVLPPDLAFSGLPEILKRFLKFCSAKRLKKIVLLSGRGEEEALKCEQLTLSCGIPATVVRASWFSQNFSEGMFQEEIQKGEIVVPVKEVKEPFVDAEDIAEVVFRALTETGHANKVYELTGPELLSFEDVAHRFSQQLGKPVKASYVPIDEYLAMLHQANIPIEEIEVIKFLYMELLDGRNERLAFGVEEALGRKSASITQFIDRHKTTDLWL